MSNRYDMIFSILLGGIVAVSVSLIILGVVLGIRDCRAQDRCEEAGGRIEHYNFRTIYIATSCGSDCTVMVPTEVSDWRCAGLPAERP